MGQSNLNRIFKPRHVAVVGASEKAGTIGNALMRNLIDGGFPGMLLPVNPKYKAIHGHESFESVSALKTGVDLAVIATPIHSVVICQNCGRHPKHKRNHQPGKQEYASHRQNNKRG